MSSVLRRADVLFSWAAAPSHGGMRHALAQWLEGVGLFAQVRTEPLREPGDPLLLAVLLGPADSWSDAAPALAHLKRGGAAVLDADAAASRQVAEVVGLPGPPARDAGAVPAGRLAAEGIPSVAVWGPLLGGKASDGRAVARLQLPGGTEAPGAFLAGDGPSPFLVLAFPVGRVAAWLLGTDGGQAGMGPSPVDGSPYAAPPLFLSRPVLDVYGEVLWRGLALLAQARGCHVMRRSPLPGGARLVVSLSHDVDGLRRGPRAFAHDAWRAAGRGRLGTALAAAGMATCTGGVRLLARAGAARRYQPHRLVPPLLARWARRAGLSLTYLSEMEDLLSAEARVGARSALFFLDNRSWANSDYALSEGLLREAVAIASRRGCETGLHGTLESASDGAILMDEARQLRASGPGPVASIRQHHLRGSTATRRHQQQAGFLVDSSLGYNFAVGFKVGTTRPFQLFDGEAEAPLGLWEVPLSVMDSAMAKSGGMAGAEQRIQGLAEEVRAVQGVLTVNWHPNFRPRGVVDHGAAYQRHLEALAAQPGTEFWALSGLVGWWRARGGVGLSAATCQEGHIHMELSAPGPVPRLGVEVAGGCASQAPGQKAFAHQVVCSLEAGASSIDVDMLAATPTLWSEER